MLPRKTDSGVFVATTLEGLQEAMEIYDLSEGYIITLNEKEELTVDGKTVKTDIIRVPAPACGGVVWDAAAFCFPGQYGWIRVCVEYA